MSDHWSRTSIADQWVAAGAVGIDRSHWTAEDWLIFHDAEYRRKAEGGFPPEPGATLNIADYDSTLARRNDIHWFTEPLALNILIPERKQAAMTDTPETPQHPFLNRRVTVDGWGPDQWVFAEWVDREDFADPADGAFLIAGYDDRGKRSAWAQKWVPWVEPKPTIAQQLQAAHEQVVTYDPPDHPNGHYLARALGLDPSSTDRLVVLPDPPEGHEQWIVTTCAPRRPCGGEAYLVDGQLYVRTGGPEGLPVPVVVSVEPAP